MAVVIMNEGLLACLASIIDPTDLSTPAWTLHLYKSNTTPTINDEFNTLPYTEADFTGYADQGVVLDNGDSIDGSNRATTTADPNTFTRSAGATSNTIYGWYLTRVGPGDDQYLVAAEKFATPVSMATVGSYITITLTLRLGREV